MGATKVNLRRLANPCRSSFALARRKLDQLGHDILSKRSVLQGQTKLLLIEAAGKSGQVSAEAVCQNGPASCPGL